MGKVRIVTCRCGEDYATRKDGISQHRRCGLRNKPVELKNLEDYSDYDETSY